MMARVINKVRRASLAGVVCFLIILTPILFSPHVSSASNLGDLGRYQVVSGSEDKAYLVDTETGAVWVLTYRTMATGREPVAIPYKFIKISPKSGNPFLIESSGQETSLPSSGK